MQQLRGEAWKALGPSPVGTGSGITEQEGGGPLAWPVRSQGKQHPGAPHLRQLSDASWGVLDLSRRLQIPRV